MIDWFYTEHYAVNIVRLWCWLTIGIFIGMFLQKNQVLERLKARLKEETDDE